MEYKSITAYGWDNFYKQLIKSVSKGWIVVNLINKGDNYSSAILSRTNSGK